MGTKVYDNYQDLITFNRNSKGTALRPIGYGDELIVNGTFDTDTNGWTASQDSILSVDSQRLRITNDVTDYGIAYQSFNTVAGSVYRVTVDCFAGTTDAARVAIGTSPGSAGIYGENRTAPDSFSFEFVPSGTTTFITLQCNTTNDTAYIEYDNISIKEVLFDRDSDPLTLFLHPAGVPRIEYDADRNLKGLLIEPTAQNSETASSTVFHWTALNTTKSYDQTTAPDGVASTADSVLEAAVTDVHTVYKDYYALAAVSYTFSCFVKSIGGRNFQFSISALGGGGSGGGQAQFNLSTGSIVSGTGTITEIGDGWYRVSGPAVTPGATGIRVIAYSINGTSTSFAGDITKGFYMWGMQVETGPIATSYMPTTGSAFTRDKDDATMTNVSGLIGQKEGTLYFEGIMREYIPGTGNYRTLMSIEGNGNIIRILRDIASSNTFFVEKLGGSGTLFIGSGTVTGTFKCAVAYANNDYELYVNGVSKGTDPSAGVPSPFDTIGLGQDLTVGGSQRIWNDHIRAIQIIPRRLSDAQLIELTS